MEDKILLYNVKNKKDLICRRTCDFSWDCLQCFILQFVLWSGMWREPEMDLIVLLEVMKWFITHSDKLRLLWPSVFLHFPLSLGTLGHIVVHLDPVRTDLWLQFHQRSMKPWARCLGSAAKPEEIKIVRDRSVVKLTVMFPSKRMYVCVHVMLHRDFQRKGHKVKQWESEVKVERGDLLHFMCKKYRVANLPCS